MADMPVMFDATVLALCDHAVLCWLATADAQGRPSVSPKEIFVASPPDRLLIADIASPRSVANVRANPAVCVAVIDIFEQRGFQLYGRAEIVAAGDALFPDVAAPLLAFASDTFTVRHAIVVTVEAVSRIVAPSHWVRPEMTDTDRRARVFDRYGVRPL
jgi:predicted pyridoxine 5'-phosphate oxidase superfamily flavin-nucleotide-binding protein